MITFQVIRWQNLLSTGNSFTEVRLDKSRTTLIIGQNGAGKSTILDALTFVLYNKPFRKVTKGLLINSITNKNLLVEIEFLDRNGKQIMVRRGSKPNIFEIYVDGELLDQDAENRDYQKALEDILGMNQKAFTQIVILGAASFIPFMQLTVPARREVIEDFMDIQVFSVMNKGLLKRASAHKEKVIEAERALRLVEAELGQAEAANRNYQADNDEMIAEKRKKIDEIATAALDVVGKLEEEQKKLDELPYNSATEKVLNQRKKELEATSQELITKIKIRQKEVDFLQRHDDCPTCNQSIQTSFKEERIRDHEKFIAMYIDEGKKCSKEIDKIDVELNEIFDLSKKRQKLVATIDEYQREIEWYKGQVDEIEYEISKLKVKKPLVDTNQMKLDLKDKQSVVDMRAEMSKVMNSASALLKDDGIKAVIIRQYIPVVNQLINKYLAEMDFFVDFHINEAFEETIKSRHRDEFSYESFSEGEKMRIDLAILFAWREVAKLRNSAATNLLVFDEVLDSSLDPNGVEEFIRIIKSMASDENIFVISHRGDAIGDKFDDVLKFTREHGFSKMEEV